MLLVQNCKPAASGSRLRKSRYCWRTKKAEESIEFGSPDPPALIVMCGAVLASRLALEFATMTIGRSPVSTVDGKVNVTRSVPGKSEAVLLVEFTTVEPMVAVIAPGKIVRTPVSETRNTVAACVPLPSFVVTVNGSAVQAAGFVALHTTARPPGPLVLVKISGCPATVSNAPRNTTPLLLIVSGKVPPTVNPGGNTNLICD